MRAILSLGSEQSWDLPWGASLIGTDASCHILLPHSTQAPPVAGVVFRWLNSCVVLGVGEPSHLLDQRGTALRRHVVTARSGEQTLPVEGHRGPPFFRFRCGSAGLSIHWEDVPAPGAVDDFSADDLAAILRAAKDYSAAAGASKAGPRADSELERLVARMTGAQSAQVVAADTPHKTLTLQSDTGGWQTRSLSLQWRRAAPTTFVPEQVSRSVSHTLDDVLNTVAAGHPTDQDPPSYSGAVVELPHFSLAIGSHWVLSQKDFAHLELPAKQVQDCQALVTSIDGRVEVIDLSDPPRLAVNGTVHRRLAVTREDTVQIAGVPVRTRLRKVAKDRVYIPARTFRILSQWSDPISQVARLGLLLSHLETPEQRRTAHLIAALSGAQAGGLCAGRHADGTFVFTPAFCQWSGDLDGGSFQSCTVLDEALRLAIDAPDGRFVSADILRDSRILSSNGDTPADLTLPFWGPLVVLTREKASFMVAWRHPGDSPFLPAELKLLDALLGAMEEDSLLVTADLKPGTSRIVARPSAASAWLSKGNLRLPLGPTTRIGSDAACDLRITWDRSMSPWHCLVVRDRNNDRILDFRSMHGTLVNRKEVSEAVLKENDRVLLGSTSLRFHFAEGMAPENLQAPGTYLPVDKDLRVDFGLVPQALSFLRLGFSAGGGVKDMSRAVTQAAADFLGGEAHLVEMGAPGEHPRCLVSIPDAALPTAFLRSLGSRLEEAVKASEPLSAGSLLWVGALPRASEAAQKSLLMVTKRSLPGGEKVWERAAAHLYPLLDRALAQVSPGRDPVLGTAATPPKLLHAEQVVPVHGVTWIGRSSECPLVVDNAAVSRRHALVVPLPDDPQAVWVIDFQSAEGIQINGQRVRQGRLGAGDVLQIHNCEIRIEIPSGAVPTVQEIGMFHEFPNLYALGYALGQTPDGERMAVGFRGLRELLGLTRLFQVNPEGRPLAAIEENGEADPDVGGLFLDLGSMKDALKISVQSGLARVVSVDIGPFLCRQTSSSVQMAHGPREKALLCVPHSRADGSKMALLLTALRPAAVAFRFEDLAVAAAVQQLLSE